jgi:transmembrane sensor
MASQESEDIWNEAMALLLNLQKAPDSEALRENIRRFCTLSPEHRDAWNEARRVYRLTGTAISAGNSPVSGRRGMISRRKLITGLGAVAAGSALWNGPDLWRRWQSDAITRVAEIKQIQLPDGSGLTLGPDSRLEIDFTQTLRKIVLLEGMALCNVVKDTERPFEAHAGALLATTTTAILEVRHNGGRSLAGVEEGQARVMLDDLNRAVFKEGLVLTAGDWVASGPAAGQIERGKRNAGQTAAWRDKLLVADREQIRSVVAEIGRWRRGNIVIPQGSLASARVSGLYDLNDPDAALAAVIGPYGGRVLHVSPWLTILTSI